MLHKCANPACTIRFRNLGRGKLFQIESEFLEAPALGVAASTRRSRSLRRVERYWLCDECAAELTLTFDQSHGVVTVPLQDTPRQRLLTSMHLQELPTPPQLGSAPGARAGMRGITWTS